MPTRALTVAAVERIKPPARGQVDYFDKGYPGLALRVSYGGSKSWVYFYRVNGGKLRRLTLGRFPSLGLAEARGAWQDARKAVGKGENPARRKSATAGTFAAVADDWLKRDQARNRSCAEVRRVVERDLKPDWGDRPFASIARADVRDLIDGIADRGAITYARRVQAHLHRLFQWALGRDLIDRNPVAGLPKPGEAAARDRRLNDAELAVVWRAAGELGWPFGPLFRLLILTAARRDEIGALRWSEIAGDRIELRGERTKNGAPHIIPLSAAAAEIVKSLPRIGDGVFVFTTTGEAPVSGWSRAKARLDAEAARLNDGRALPDWRLHDLRRTAASAMQRLGIGLQVIEAVLGHVGGSRAGIVHVYQQYDFAAEKAAALEAWARHVAAIAGGAPTKVVVMRAGAR